MKKTPQKTKTAESVIAPYYDDGRRTCMLVDEKDGIVKYVPLDVTNGLEACESSRSAFDHEFKLMVGYPVKKACILYKDYSLNIGATKEVLDYLGQIITITKQEYDMATKKKAAKKADEKPKSTVAKSAKQDKGKQDKPSTKGAKKQSAADMFKTLIMQGKLTDDEIFGRVKSEFGLDDKKRGYVKWYRNWLKKDGQNPPAAK